MGIFDSISNWWSGLDTSIQSTVISSASTVLVSIIGIGVVLWQVSSQFRQNRDSIAETERRRLKADLFEKSIKISQEFSEAAGELTTYSMAARQSIEIASEMAKLELNFPIPTQRVLELQRLHSVFSEKGTSLMKLVETRLVFDPRLILFRDAVGSVLHDVRVIFQESYFKKAMHSLPTDRPEGGIFEYVPPTDNTELISLTNALMDFLGDASAYASDFEVEMQNLLLGDLFEESAPYRQPLDKSKKVIRLDKFDELQRYLSNETAWGKLCLETDQKVKKALNDKQDS